MYVATFIYWPVDSASFLTLGCWFGMSVKLGHFKHKDEFSMCGMGIH